MAVSLRRVIFWALCALGRGFERGATLVFYTAAGLVRLEDIRRAIRQEWTNEALRQSGPSVSSGLTAMEQAVYLKILKPDDRVLIVGCGTGRDLLALHEAGYTVDGLDAVPPAVDIAERALRARGFRASIYTGTIETVTLPGSSFNAVIVSCYGFIPQSTDRIRVLQKIRELLKPDGRIVLTYVTLPTLPSRVPILVTRFVARLVGSDWHPEYGDVFRPASSGPCFAYYRHVFPPGALEEEARAAGLRVVLHEPADEGIVVLTA